MSFFSVPPSLDGAGSTEEVTVVRGNTASFICIADGTPSPTITWLRNGAAVPKDAHLSLLNQNTTLQISHVRVNHTGRYTCTAHNQAGDASRHFSLKVLGEKKSNKIKQDQIDSFCHRLMDIYPISQTHRVSMALVCLLRSLWLWIMSWSWFVRLMAYLYLHWPGWRMGDRCLRQTAYGSSEMERCSELLLLR